MNATNAQLAALGCLVFGGLIASVVATAALIRSGRSVPLLSAAGSVPKERADRSVQASPDGGEDVRAVDRRVGTSRTPGA